METSNLVERRAAVRLLVIDWRPIFRFGICTTLRDAGGYEIVGEGCDAASAILMMVSLRPDIVLLGLPLPDSSGLELLARHKEIGIATRILLIASDLDRLQTVTALRLGARGIVAREASPETLLRATEAVMRGEIWIGREVLADWVEYAERQKLPRMSVTPREREIIDLVVAGFSNTEIAKTLSLSSETIKTHVSNIYRKCGVSNRVELTAYICAGKLQEIA